MHINIDMWKNIIIMNGYLQDPANDFLTPIIFYDNYIVYNDKKYNYSFVENQELFDKLQKYTLLGKKIKHIISCSGNVFYIYV